MTDFRRRCLMQGSPVHARHLLDVPPPTTSWPSRTPLPATHRGARCRPEERWLRLYPPARL